MYLFTFNDIKPFNVTDIKEGFYRAILIKLYQQGGIIILTTLVSSVMQ